MPGDPIENEEAAIDRRAKSALKAYRLARGWSMREMAAFLGVKDKSYEAYEGKPERGVPTHVIARFCRYTDTSTDSILLGKPAIRKAI